ncbi:MAG: ATP-binding protein [Gemmatimonadetes bacterium]|nr:ATP-binding protein [Gemmatimonadota bacterium]MDA1104148.1 ATP-binding protein [Gemmatimonadota bacterium]
MPSTALPGLRIHHTLFAGVLTIVGGLVLLIILSVNSGLRRQLDATFEHELERQLALADALVTSSAATDPDSLARLIAARLEYRVTLIALSGTVLGDSHVQTDRLGAVENHRERPEVQAALAGRSPSFARRSSTTVGESFLYGARQSRLADVPVILRIAAPQTDIDRALGDFRRTVALSGLFAMFVAMMAAYGLSRAFTRPLVDLADRAGRLAKGDFTSRVPRSRVVELRDLAVAFNRLADELQERLSDLRRERDEMQALIDCMAEGVIALNENGEVVRTNRAARALLDLGDAPVFAPLGSLIRHASLRNALERSVTESTQAKEIDMGARHFLLASRALDHGGAVTTLLDVTHLRRLEQVRRDFVANASHELKTPLTSIRGYAETLVETDPPEPTRRKFMESIRNNTLRLQRLVDDLLDLSRLDSGGWVASPDALSVSDVVWESWDLISARVDASRTFTLNGDADVVADRDGLLQVFSNLFENAVRHTDSHGHVAVIVDSDDAGRVAHISVTDDGEGIPARSLPRIFERFYRADSSRARDFGGTGLGLAIVKHFIGAMGGEIEAESEWGKGTTIRFTLPLKGTK